MSASRTVKMAWLVAAQSPFWSALTVLAGVGGLILAGQMTLSAPVMPSWRGLVVVTVGLVPDLLGILGPVAVLVASLLTSRSWFEGGEYRGLMATGLGLTPVLKIAVIWGVLVGAGVASCTHFLGPMGRSMARSVVNNALTEASIVPGVRLQIGDVFLGAGPAGASDAGVVVATRDWVAWADEGMLEDGGIRLISGQAKALDDAWRLRFDEARWPLPDRLSQPHNFSRTTPELLHHIDRLRDAERDAGRAELTLLKRSTLALSTPLFAVIGVMLAFGRRHPLPWAVVLVFGVWLLQRVSDHSVGTIDASILAGLPLAVLCVVAISMSRKLGSPA